MRKIFWNARESFFGANFLTFIPKNYLIRSLYPSGGGNPPKWDKIKMKSKWDLNR